MIKTIVSGGQTGVDQAALKMAQELGISIGGWCCKGGLDENGDFILEQYSALKEATTVEPDERTKLNIKDSDGTLIILPCLPMPEYIKDGTILTISEVNKQNKPYFMISLKESNEPLAKLQTF